MIEDEKTGIVAKLAGEGRARPPKRPDHHPSSSENPELPIEDIKVAPLRRRARRLHHPARPAPPAPPKPSSPPGAPPKAKRRPRVSLRAHDRRRRRSLPRHRSRRCPTPPSSSAGTPSPAAGKYSPLIFKLCRQDGTQRMAKIEATLPERADRQAGRRRRLLGGRHRQGPLARSTRTRAPREQADPSCPASSQIGTVVGSAGAGPTPYYTTGHAYLAGPYKGAPLSDRGDRPRRCRAL